jgi:hypothetical protein
MTGLSERAQAAGQTAGQNAADWWAQERVGGRATGDVAATARRTLQGIRYEDPEVMNSLPSPAGTAESWYGEIRTSDSPAWGDLPADVRWTVVDSYRLGFSTGVEDGVSRACTLALGPEDPG